MVRVLCLLILLLPNAHANISINWEQSGDTLQKQYKLSQANGITYASRMWLEKTKLTQHIQSGHPQQLGRLEINQGKVIAYSSSGKILWDNRYQRPICLPELFGEFIRLHHQPLIAGKTILCDGPIIKAAKLAPFKVRLVKTSKDRRTFEISPGSIGMHFFMNPIFLDTDLTVKRVYRYQGVLPLATSISGEIEYIITQWSAPIGVEITDFVHSSMQ
jgi:hypothetical protein